MIRSQSSSAGSRPYLTSIAVLAALAIGVSSWYFMGGPGGEMPAFGGGQGDRTKQQDLTRAGHGTPPRPGIQKARYAPGVVVVGYYPRTTQRAREAKATRLDLIDDTECQSPYFNRYYIGADALRAGETVESMIARLKRDPDVRFAEPDYAVTPDQALPNDLRFNEQWALHNLGQTGGTIDADIDAPDAWANSGPGSTVIVAVMDDGCQWDHVDIAANVWTNPGEIPGNLIDDDGNGKIDDIRGWDFSDNDNNPAPAAGDTHGTHTSGTVAAVTNNGIGIAGVAQNVRLMPVRMYGGAAAWMTALANGIDYAWQNGAKVISVSYNIDAYTQALSDAIGRAATADVIYVNSAGNNGQQNPPRQVLRTIHNNVVFVAATDDNDVLASFSNFGTLVDIAAPGVDTLSTIPPNTYALMSGTSMATPHMAGACAVIRSQYPALTARQTLDRLINTAEMKPSLIGKVNGGRLNINRALETDNIPPSDPTNLTWLAYSTRSFKIRFNGSGDDGTVGQASTYDIRVSTSPINSGNFLAAQQVYIPITPVNAGVPITTEVGGLPPGSSLYVGVRAVDNLGNVSNVLSGGPFSTRSVPVDYVEGTSWFAPVSGPWAITTEQPFQGTRSWSDSPGGNYVNNANTELRSQRLIMSGPSTFNFMVKYSLESDYDYLFWDVSLDGVNWQNMGSATGESGGWKQISAALPDYPNSGLVKQSYWIRFRLTSDTSIVKDGVYIDSMFASPLAVLHTDNMEGGPQYTADSPWALTTLRNSSPIQSWTDSPAGNYGNLADTNLTSINQVDTSNLASALISFKAFISTEEGYDYLTVRSSTDGGSYVDRGSWSGTLTTWSAYSAPLGPGGLVRWRFNFSSDSSVVGEGVYVDDVRIVGEPFSPVP